MLLFKFGSFNKYIYGNRIIFHKNNKISMLIQKNCYDKYFCTNNEKDQNYKQNKKKFFETFSYEDFTTKINDLKNDFNNTSYIKDLNEMLIEMEKRKYDTKKMRIIILIFIICLLIIFYDIIINWAGQQTTNITTKSLNDPKFKKQVVKFCEETIEELVKSKNIQDNVSNLLKNSVIDLSKDEQIRKSLIELLSKIIITDEMKNSGSQLCEQVVDKIMNSPEHENLRKLIYIYLSNEIQKLSNDKQVQNNLGKLINASLKAMIFGSK